MKDGHLNKCIECTKKDVASRVALKSKEPEWVIAERRRHREKTRKYRKDGREAKIAPEVRRSVHNKWIKNNPEKHRAHNLCQHIQKQPCSICGNPKAQKHHEDYSKPRDVIWLCVLHHAARHVAIREAALINAL